MTNTTVNPSEVGWQFVPQYYTFVNKQPNRLHCFYTKSSTFIHGTEGEDGKPCYGQQEIHAKITSIGFQDCKVFIHSVDAQSSANGGIIIQVIGEMSNHGEPWRKFVQTFFLAEQPNGYFVLNDIFRFLKEESVDDDQSSEVDGVSIQDQPSSFEPVSLPPAPVTPAPPPPPPQVEPEPEPTREPTPPPPVVEETPAPVEPEPVPEPQPQLNGYHEDEVEPEPESVADPEPVATASPPPVSPEAPAHQPLEPTPAPPPVQQPPPPAPAPAPVPAPVAAAPAAPTPQPPRPKTWANLAATNSNKWGAAVAQEVKGVSEAPVQTSSPAPSSHPQSPAPHGRPQQPSGQHHPAFIAARDSASAQCFVKSVTENITEAALKEALTTRFGPVKDVSIVRSKACAFLEFVDVSAARRAMMVSLPPSQGGEGGVRIGDHKVIVDHRKERNERPPPRTPPVNGERGRGGFRGGRGGPGGGRGRGGPPTQK